MCRNELTSGDRFAMLVGKVVIWGSIIWFATAVVRPIVEGTDVSIHFGKEHKDA